MHTRVSNEELQQRARLQSLQGVLESPSTATVDQLSSALRCAVNFGQWQLIGLLLQHGASAAARLEHGQRLLQDHIERQVPLLMRGAIMKSCHNVII